MRDEPSRTAQSVAAAEFLLSYDPILGDLVPREAVAPTRWCLESVPGFHGKLYHLLRWGWLRRYLRFLERKYIPGITAHVGLRKRWIEENVRNAINAGCSQVVVLGAGFDTLAYRLHQEYADVHWWEID